MKICKYFNTCEYHSTCKYAKPNEYCTIDQHSLCFDLVKKEYMIQYQQHQRKEKLIKLNESNL
jgi:hypothetical protein